MALQYSVAERTAELNTLVTDVGVNAQIIGYSGAMPANVGTAPTGTLLVQFAGNATAYGAVATGTLTANAVANATAAASGTLGYFRVNTSAGVAVYQGAAFPQVVIATSALTSANGNVLTFTSTTGVAVGMNVTGAGIPANTTVVAFSATQVTISNTSTAGVASAASITFNGDFTVNPAAVTAGQTCTFGSHTLTRGGV
jgi:hypothetical protein